MLVLADENIYINRQPILIGVGRIVDSDVYIRLLYIALVYSSLLALLGSPTTTTTPTTITYIRRLRVRFRQSYRSSSRRGDGTYNRTSSRASAV